MNRAVGRRTMFERRADFALFLERIGEAVEKGWIEVHAYSVLTTHFHALVRSPVGQLSRALHHIQLGYVRYFNRTRRRDGPLVRGRFRSKLVDSLTYRRVLVGYIDANAPRTGLADHAANYPFGSCRDYVTDSGPAWLCRDWVHGEVCAQLGLREFRGERYAEVFQAGFTDVLGVLVERRMARPTVSNDPLDSMLAEATPAVLAWLRSKTLLADGTQPGLTIVPSKIVLATVRQARPRLATLDRSERDKWSATLALLLRNMAGLTFAEIGDEMGTSHEGARQMSRRARSRMTGDGIYATHVAQLGHQAVESAFGRVLASQRP